MAMEKKLSYAKQEVKSEAVCKLQQAAEKAVSDTDSDENEKIWRDFKSVDELAEENAKGQE